MSKLNLIPYEKKSTLKGKNLLPLGANSFYLELTLFRRGLIAGRQPRSQKYHPCTKW